MAESSASVSANRSGTSGTKKRKAEEADKQSEELIDKATPLLKRVADFLTNSRFASSQWAQLMGLQFALQNVVTKRWSEATLRGLKLRLGNGNDENAQVLVDLFHEALDELSELYERRLKYANAIPAPSQYGKMAVWAEWQMKDTAILCFRPSDKQGLPLCVLDDVFRDFQQLVREPLPPTEDARKAMNAAYNLCHTMPNQFATEADRGRSFDECLDPVLPRSKWRKEVHISAATEVSWGRTHRTYEVDGVVCILREDKVESGTADDAYMQISRVYQLYVEEMREKNPSLVEQGLPMILLCVIGPILLICGGFYDTKSTIVEPLVQPCLMFHDCLHIRQEALARQLYALKKALATLCSRSTGTIKRHQAGVPRVFTTYMTMTEQQQEERSLTFLHPLMDGPPQPLLFIAAEDSSNEKLVKLVVGKYGTDVHRLLARHHFAPELYGYRSLEGAPTAYIMEYLYPPTSTKPGWVTLFEFFTLKDLTMRYSDAIRATLDSILKLMEEKMVVHGDLRPNNVMLEVDSKKIPVCSGEKQGVNLRVVDFDWAGASGQVEYPLQRNENITWPGAAGTAIIIGHDRTLVRNIWPRCFVSI